MRFFVGGYAWDVGLHGPFPTRREALAALEKVPALGVRSNAFAEAMAAYDVADYAHCISCAEDAHERAFDLSYDP